MGNSDYLTKEVIRTLFGGTELLADNQPTDPTPIDSSLSVELISNSNGKDTLNVVKASISHVNDVNRK